IIAHVDGNHYVVVNSVDQNTVTYVESTGREYTVPIDSFMVRFDGNALIAEEPPAGAVLLADSEMNAILGAFDAPLAIAQARENLAAVLGIPIDPSTIAYLSHAVDAGTSYYTVEFAYPVTSDLSNRYQVNYDDLGKIISIIDVKANKKMYMVGTSASAYYYTTINNALAAVDYGDSYADVVYITDGTYNESIAVDGKNLIIRGKGTISGAGYASAISITNDADVTIEGLTIKDSSYGIYVAGSSTLIVRNNIIRDNTDHGIKIMDDSTVVIEENWFTNNFVAIGNNNGSLSISNNLIVKNTIGIYDNSTAPLEITINRNIINSNNTGLRISNVSTQASELSGMNNIGANSYNYYGSASLLPGDFNTDPLFVNVMAGNFTLQLDSPCLKVNNPALTEDIGAASQRAYVITTLPDGTIRTSDKYGNKLKDVKTGEYAIIYHYVPYNSYYLGYTKTYVNGKVQEYNDEGILTIETENSIVTYYVWASQLQVWEVSLQQVVSAFASEGADRIFVREGTYTGGISIAGDLEIIGEGNGKTIIDAAGNDYGIEISSGAQAKISGLTIKNALTAGIYLNSASGTEIYNNEIVSNPLAIKIENSFGAVEISHNTITGNLSGIFFNTVTSAVVNDNIFAFNDDYALINLGGGTITYSNNDFFGGDISGTFTNGGGNISSDPLFVNAAEGDYYVQYDSPALGLMNTTDDDKGAIYQFTETTVDGVLIKKDRFDVLIAEIKPGDYTRAYHYVGGVLTGSRMYFADGSGRYIDYNANGKFISEFNPATGKTTIFAGEAAAITDIQDAIDAAANGDTVYVLEGEYVLTETIQLKSGVKLIGAGDDVVTIIGPEPDMLTPAYKSVIQALSDTTIEGFTLVSLNEGYGIPGGISTIYLDGAVNVAVKNNTFEGGEYGIVLRNGAEALVENNLFRAIENAITLGSAEKANINYNTFYGNNAGIRLEVDYAGNSTSGSVLNNIFYENGIGVYVIDYTYDGETPFPQIEGNIDYGITTSAYERFYVYGDYMTGVSNGPFTPPASNIEADPQFIKPDAFNFYMELDSAVYGKGRSYTLITETLPDGTEKTLDRFGNVLKEEKAGEYTIIYHFANGAANEYVKVFADGSQEAYDILGRMTYSVTAAGEKTIYVGEDYSYKNIQDAVDAASDGDTISIAAGTYVLTETTVIDGKELNVKGAGSGLTIIDGSYVGYAIAIVSGAVVEIEGVTVKNSLNANIIAAGNSIELTNLTIENSVILGGYIGVQLVDTAAAYIIDNEIYNSSYAAIETSGSNVTIYNNTIANSGTVGIYDLSSQPVNLDIRYNIIAFVEYGIYFNNPDVLSVTMDYNDIYGYAVNYSDPLLAGANDISEDPEFIDAANGNFFLEADSPALLAGMGAVLESDYAVLHPDANTTEYYDDSDHILKKETLNPAEIFIYRYASGSLSGYDKYAAGTLVETAVYEPDENIIIGTETRIVKVVMIVGTGEIFKYDSLTGKLVWRQDELGNKITYHYNNTTEWTPLSYTIINAAGSSEQEFDPQGKLISTTTMADGQKTIHVGADKHFTGIAQAIAFAEAADIVSVDAGTYTLTAGIAMKSGVKLYGAGREMTIIDASAVMYAIELNYVSNVEIKDFTIQGAAFAGIKVFSDDAARPASNIKIRYNTIKQNTTGIVLTGNTDAEVWFNIIYSNYSSGNMQGAGIEISDTYDYNTAPSVSFNTISGNHHGIALNNANASIGYNIIAFNDGGLGGDSTGVLASGDGVVSMENNDVYGNSVDYEYSGYTGGSDITYSNISQDPKFVDLQRGNFFPQADSPCLAANIGAIPGSAYTITDNTATDTKEYRDSYGNLLKTEKPVNNPTETIIYHYTNGVLTGYLVVGGADYTAIYDAAGRLIAMEAYYSADDTRPNYQNKLKERIDLTVIPNDHYYYSYGTAPEHDNRTTIRIYKNIISGGITVYDELTYGVTTSHILGIGMGTTSTTYIYDNYTDWNMLGYNVATNFDGYITKREYDASGRLLAEKLPGQPRKAYVNMPDKGYADIQSAIDSSLEGDIVEVGSGTYTLTAPLVIAKGITLRKAGGADSVTIIGATTGNAISVSNASGTVVIEGFIIKNRSAAESAVYLDAASSVIIRNNIIRDGGFGITLKNGSQADISNNTFYIIGGTAVKVYVPAVTQSTITNNIFYGSNKGVLISDAADTGASALPSITGNAAYLNTENYYNEYTYAGREGESAAFTPDVSNIQADPKFVDPAGNNFYVQLDSSAQSGAAGSAAAKGAFPSYVIVAEGTVLRESDAYGHLLRITDSVTGSVTIYHYLNGVLVGETTTGGTAVGEKILLRLDPRGEYAVYVDVTESYTDGDWAGRIKTAEGADEFIYDFTYQLVNGRVDRTVTRRQTPFTAEYDDATGNILRFESLLGVVSEFAYDTAWRLTGYTETYPDGTIKSYDGGYNLISINVPDASLIEYYTGGEWLGKEKKRIEGGLTHDYTYYAGTNGRVAKVDICGDVIAEYDDATGKMISYDSGAGEVTTYQYDSDWYLVSYIIDDGAFRATYSDADVLLEREDIAGEKIDYFYTEGEWAGYPQQTAYYGDALITDNYTYGRNAAGKVIAIAAREGFNTVTVYDYETKNLLSYTDGDGVFTEYFYGESWILSGYTVTDIDESVLEYSANGDILREYIPGVSDTTYYYAGVPIAGTDDDYIYQTYREGNTLTYSATLDNGLYEVVFHFAELDPDYAYDGAAVFDVYMNGQLALDDYDIYASAGSIDTAVSEVINTTVTDGELNIEFRAVNGRAAVSAIEIYRINSAPLWRDFSDRGTNENEAMASIDLNSYTTDGDADEMAYSIVSIEHNGVFKQVNKSEELGMNITDGIFTWTPSYDASGTWKVRFSANDTEDEAVSGDLIVTVNNVDTAPAIITGDQAINENQTLVFSVKGQDDDRDTLIYAVDEATLPAGALFESSVGDIRWQPTYAQAGTYTITLKVSDDNGANWVPKDITITVADVVPGGDNNAPVWAPALNVSVTENETIAPVALDTYCSDGDGDVLAYSISYVERNGAQISLSTAASLGMNITGN
ncbi:MAG: right-handed parallel beta-helix repeat-containing protein, partial [Candidatus Omnitrophota bacterium]|nr:right-handed parallel beta-helix repeat-containing protein [Candidatus Omnitrophota bacterium]